MKHTNIKHKTCQHSIGMVPFRHLLVDNDHLHSCYRVGIDEQHAFVGSMQKCRNVKKREYLLFGSFLVLILV